MTDPSTTRTDLQRVAVHVLARRRQDVTGRFGLRATPGGFGTPAFGPDDAIEVLRVDGAVLVHEVGRDARAIDLDGATLNGLADAVGVDLGAELSVGQDTPALGDPDAPLTVDPVHAAAPGDWFDLGWRSLDRVAAGTGGGAAIQLWPEHFDAGTSLAVGPGIEDQTNIGASAGDGFHADPYLYVGPWGTDRPGDAAYWNAPFGAVLGRSDVRSLDDAVAFFQRGIDLLLGGSQSSGQMS